MNITLHIVEAANLSLIGMMKSVPDPYCKVIIGNRRQKTAFLRKTTNPRWDFRFTFENVSAQSPVHIEVRDHARLKKDRMIGVLETDVQKLLNNPISWWPLVGREGTGGTLYIDAKCNNFQNLPMGQQKMFQQQGMGMGSTLPQQGLGSTLTQGVGSGLIGSGLGSTLPQQGLGSNFPQQGLGSSLSQGSYVPQGQGTTTGLTGVGTTHKHHGLGSLLHPTEMLHGGSTLPQQGMPISQGMGSTLPQQSLGSTVPMQGFETGSSFPQQGMGTMGSTFPQQGMPISQGLGSTLPQQGLGSTVPMQGVGTGTGVPQQQGTTTHIHIHKN